MRKILSLILVAIMAVSVFSLVACDNATNNNSTPEETESEGTKTPDSTAKTTDGEATSLPTTSEEVDTAAIAKLISDAVEKTKDNKSYSITIDGYNEEFDGEDTWKDKAYMDLTIEDISAQDMVFSANGYSEFDGEKTDIFLGYINGFYYINSMGMKLKLTADEVVALGAGESFSSIDELGDSLDDAIRPIPADVLANAEVKKDGGNTTVTVTLTDEQFKNVFSSYYEDGLENFTYGAEVKSSKCSDIKVVITVNEQGYVTYYSIDFKVAIEYEDVFGEGDYIKSNVTSSEKYTFNNPGSTHKVTAPADEKEYMSFKEMLIAVYSEMDWKELGADKLNLNVSTWDEFISVNGANKEDFAEVMEFLTWSEFKAILLEDLQ